MWAKVDENGAVEIIKNPHNFPVAEKTVVSDIRGLSASKVAKIKHMKDHANYILTKTDWYVIRKMEKGTAIPVEIEAERDNVKAAVAAQEEYLSDAARTADELTAPETGLEQFD